MHSHNAFIHGTNERVSMAVRLELLNVVTDTYVIMKACKNLYNV